MFVCAGLSKAGTDHSWTPPFETKCSSVGQPWPAAFPGQLFSQVLSNNTRPTASEPWRIKLNNRRLYNSRGKICQNSADKAFINVLIWNFLIYSAVWTGGIINLWLWWERPNFKTLDFDYDAVWLSSSSHLFYIAWRPQWNTASEGARGRWWLHLVPCRALAGQARSLWVPESSWSCWKDLRTPSIVATSTCSRGCAMCEMVKEPVCEDVLKPRLTLY